VTDARLTRALIVLALAGTAILSAARPVPGAGAESTTVEVPWRPGNAETFRAGSPEEGGRHSAVGSLPVTVYRPAGEGRAPFVVLLHGCGGLGHEAMWAQWVEVWVDLLGQHGVGAAVVDSFVPRGVSQVCTRNPGAWAVRRADDAYSVRAWLAEQPYVDDRRIAVMGMSNGGPCSRRSARRSSIRIRSSPASPSIRDARATPRRPSTRRCSSSSVGRTR
jgi:dipeptidyl aminopeptidase/acylaminoacyl peptidase